MAFQTDFTSLVPRQCGCLISLPDQPFDLEQSKWKSVSCDFYWVFFLWAKISLTVYFKAIGIFFFSVNSVYVCPLPSTFRSSSSWCNYSFDIKEFSHFPSHVIICFCFFISYHVQTFKFCMVRSLSLVGLTHSESLKNFSSCIFLNSSIIRSLFWCRERSSSPHLLSSSYPPHFSWYYLLNHFHLSVSHWSGKKNHPITL